jgi:hypothetical protein
VLTVDACQGSEFDFVILRFGVRRFRVSDQSKVAGAQQCLLVCKP